MRFRARTLPGWVTELGGDRPVRTVGLAVPAAARRTAIRDALFGMPDGGVVVPDLSRMLDYFQVPEVRTSTVDH